MTKSKTAVSAKTHRYEFVHSDGADFVAYQRRSDDGNWTTFASWMIPRTAY